MADARLVRDRAHAVAVGLPPGWKPCKFSARGDSQSVMAWWHWTIVAFGIAALELALVVAMCRAAAAADRRDLALARVSVVAGRGGRRYR